MNVDLMHSGGLLRVHGHGRSGWAEITGASPCPGGGCVHQRPTNSVNAALLPRARPRRRSCPRLCAKNAVRTTLCAHGPAGHPRRTDMPATKACGGALLVVTNMMKWDEAPP